MYFPLFVGVLCLSLFCYALLCVFSSFAIILKRKRERELVALLLLTHGCLVTVNVLWLFLTMPWVGLQYVIVVFHDHTHLPFHVGFKECPCIIGRVPMWEGMRTHKSQNKCACRIV